MKKTLSRIYILALLALTVGFTVMIWDLTFAHLVEEYHQRKHPQEAVTKEEAAEADKLKATFQKAIIESEETVKHYLGYRVLEEKRLKGHFHHIDVDIVPDQRNYCVTCHGDIPHDKYKDLRAFGNMHAAFIGCQTCHIRLEGEDKTGVFKWYDRTTGEIVGSPVLKGQVFGNYSAKIIPFERVNGVLQRIDSQEKIDFAEEYRRHEKTLSEVQKSKAQKIIHQQMSKQPYICESCHQVESPLLPFKELGYSKQRINAFVGTEVIGMIKKYTQFYLPHILQPGFGPLQNGGEQMP
ncbi:MAG: hypothetical protein P8X96_07700 [Desulfobacteraceae bacterium]|jgi:hypothetical protein